MRKEYDFSKGKRGPAIESPGKTRITIMLDNDIIEAFRERVPVSLIRWTGGHVASVQPGQSVDNRLVQN